ncbi:uncharacterized protein [Gossypium hirsutum]|uniref:Uncharacterized protein n=1 Tax=Gossypium hirsutum TaxID=3635 RepID=A0A1U8MTU5_GOSHI|nr:uncharacterized protein LOC107941216 [Gossypium hirsutum]
MNNWYSKFVRANPNVQPPPPPPIPQPVPVAPQNVDLVRSSKPPVDKIRKHEAEDFRANIDDDLEKGKDSIQWLTRSDDENTEEEDSKKEGSKEEAVDDDKVTEDDDVTPYHDDFENLFASKKPFTGGLVIHDPSDQPTVSYKKSIIKGKDKRVARSSEGPRGDLLELHVFSFYFFVWHVNS